MNILISTFGVRGDVQPYLALAVGLQAAGHRVTLATSQNFTAWIESYGVHTHPTSFNFQETLQQPEAQAVVQGKNFARQMRLLREAMSQSPEAQDSAWAAIQEADLVIQSPTGTGALEAARARGIPVAFASPVPFTPTRAFPSFNMASLRVSLGGRYNLATHKLAQRMMWNVMGSPMSAHLRTKLGLRPWRSYGELLASAHSVGAPWLYGFSAHVLPRPVDWDETQHVTGYWFLDAPPDWAPDANLLRFLESGPPPVYIGFGSGGFLDPEGQTQLALQALELSGQRGVLLTSWDGIARQPAPPNVYVVDSVPHGWLFPRMAAVVHHGGAGTLAAGLTAGLPTLVIPFGGDQPFWGDRVHALGAGPRPIVLEELTAERLAESIGLATSDAAMRARAAEVGRLIQAERGVEEATAIIGRYLAQRPRFFEGMA